MSWSGNWIVVYIITTEQKKLLKISVAPRPPATALCAVGQPASRVEGPLHVVEGC